jgi:hypothetical protein
MSPFQNESESLEIGGLTAENRIDRVTLYGSIEITKDKTGLEQALALKQLVDACVAALQAEQLPDQIKISPADDVDNPFNQS